MALIGDTAVNLFCENEPSEKVQLRSLVSINRHLSFPLSAAPELPTIESISPFSI